MVFLRSVRRLLVTASVVPSLSILVTLTIEALSSSQTSVLTIATRRNIPEEAILHCSVLLVGVRDNARMQDALAVLQCPVTCSLPSIQFLQGKKRSPQWYSPTRFFCHKRVKIRAVYFNASLVFGSHIVFLWNCIHGHVVCGLPLSSELIDVRLETALSNIHALTRRVAMFMLFFCQLCSVNNNTMFSEGFNHYINFSEVLYWNKVQTTVLHSSVRLRPCNVTRIWANDS
jgi:hypothetical protein